MGFPSIHPANLYFKATIIKLGALFINSRDLSHVDLSKVNVLSNFEMSFIDLSAGTIIWGGGGGGYLQTVPLIKALFFKVQCHYKYE